MRRMNDKQQVNQDSVASPLFDEFMTMASDGYNLIPVRRKIKLSGVTAESLLQGLRAEKRGFLLEGEAFGEASGGRVVIGCDTLLRLQLFPTTAALMIGPSRRELSGKPLVVLQQALDKLRCPDQDKTSAVCGSLFGYLDYDAAATWERVRGVALAQDRLLGEWMLCRTLLFYDTAEQSATIVSQTPVRKNRSAAIAYAAANRHIETIAKRLTACREVCLNGEPAGFDAAQNKQTRLQYTGNVSAAKQYIQAGDAFQIVVSQMFSRPAGETQPLYRYRQLKKNNPSPYMFYFSAGESTLMGTSPEMLVRVTNGRAYSRPIAGTRRRGATAAEDNALAQSLLADEKECAEHAMLVDLSRNDLGRIAAPGTVIVKDVMRVERFMRVMHMVSYVEADCEPETTATDVLAACFPAGTVSGAPKARAMEIIHELEQDFRGPYAGAFGWLNANGDLDTCIVIRTAWQEAGILHVRVGAGIVADSEPDKEYEEIQMKASAVLAALEAKRNDSAD